MNYYLTLFKSKNDITVGYKKNKTKFQMNRYASFSYTLGYPVLHYGTVFADANIVLNYFLLHV
jgi:hypothetical protein